MAGRSILSQSTRQMMRAALEQHPLSWRWPSWLESLWIDMMALGGILAWYILDSLQLSLAVLALTGGIYGACFLMARQGGWIPLEPPVITLDTTPSRKLTVLNQRLKAENLGIKTEFYITRRFQPMLWPSEQERQSIAALNIVGWYVAPCDEADGDYNDVLSHNDSLRIGIGNVIGHGLASGLTRLMGQTIMRTLLARSEAEADTQFFLNSLKRIGFHNAQRINYVPTMLLTLLNHKEDIPTLNNQQEDVLVIRTKASLEQVDTVNLGCPIALEENIDGLKRLCHITKTNHQLSAQTAQKVKPLMINGMRRHIRN